MQIKADYDEKFHQEIENELAEMVIEHYMTCQTTFFITLSLKLKSETQFDQ